MDPLRDQSVDMIWRLSQLGIDVKGYFLMNWTHGVLQFDLKMGGIKESHKANLKMIKVFKDIFEQKKDKKVKK